MVENDSIDCIVSICTYPVHHWVCSVRRRDLLPSQHSFAHKWFSKPYLTRKKSRPGPRVPLDRRLDAIRQDDDLVDPSIDTNTRVDD